MRTSGTMALIDHTSQDESTTYRIMTWKAGPTDTHCSCKDKAVRGPVVPELGKPA